MDPNRVVPAVGLLALACAGEPGPNASIRADSSGVAIVIAPAEDRGLDWSWSPRIVLGGRDAGPESFYAVSRAVTAVDTAGRVFVLDLQAARVVRFDPQGGVDWTAGAGGGGPGEMLMPRLVAAPGDGGALVYDARKRALLPFDSAGRTLDPIPAVPRPEGIQAFAGGLLLVTRHYHREGTASPTSHTFRLALAHPTDTVAIAETAPGRTFLTQFEGCGPAARTAGPVIFAPQLRWHASPAALAVNAGAAYLVNVYAPPGRLVRSIRRPAMGRPATRDDALAWAAANPIRLLRDGAECRIAPDEMVDRMGYADSAPAIADLALAPSGELWVRRWAPEDPGGPIDIFDATGAYLGTLPPAFPFPLHFLPTGEPIFVARDETDVERLAVAVLSR